MMVNKVLLSFSVRIGNLQIGNGYLEIDVTLRKNGNEFNKLDGDGNIDEPFRLVNNAFASAFSFATFRTTGCEERGQNLTRWQCFND